MTVCSQCGRKAPPRIWNKTPELQKRYVCKECYRGHMGKTAYLNVDIPYNSPVRKRIKKHLSNRDLLMRKYQQHLDRMSDEDVTKILKKVSKHD